MAQNSAVAMCEIAEGCYVRYNQTGEIRMVESVDGSTLELVEFGAFDTETVSKESIWHSADDGHVDIITSDHDDWDDVGTQFKN